MSVDQSNCHWQLGPTLGVRCKHNTRSPPALCSFCAAERLAYFFTMMQACRRAAGALASTSLPADALRASLPAACQRLYHKNVRSPAKRVLRQRALAVRRGRT